MMAKIEVGYTSIPVIGSAGIYHKYILYTDNTGKQYYARGGPESRLTNDTQGPFPFGSIKTEAGEYKAGTPDWDRARAGEPGLTPHPRETITEGGDLSSQWEKIKKRMQDIGDQGIDYEMEDSNSNASVDEALREAGLPEPIKDGPENYWAPGSGYDLPGGTVPAPDTGKDFMQDFRDWISKNIGWDNFLDNLKKKILDPLEDWSMKIPSSISDLFDDAVTFQPRDPLAIDLTGDGIQTVAINPAAPILFDHNGDGAKTATGWLQGSDAWLVHDISGNGTIDSGLELFGVDTDITVGGVIRKATNGFEALAALDGNGDKIFDAKDVAFAQVRLWQDLDQDGISDTGELSTLATKGIVSISLNYTSTNTNLGGGNSITGKAVVTRTTGNSEIDSVSVGADSTANNLNLADNPFYREFTETVELTSAASTLPNMGGSGAVRDLRDAMSLTAPQGSSVFASAIMKQAARDLTSTVQAFVAATTRDQQRGLLDNLVQQWGKTANLDTADNQLTSSSPGDRYVQPFSQSNPALYRKIVALEQFNGTSGLSQVLTRFSGTLPDQVVTLFESAYTALRESVYQGLVLQTRLRPYFYAISLVVDDTGIRFDTSNLSATLTSKKATDFDNAFFDLVELNKYAQDTLQAVGFDGMRTLGSWFDALTADSALRAKMPELGLFSGAATVGTTASDLYWGDAENNSFSGGAGDDALASGAGADTLEGGGGNDALQGGIGKDVLYGGNDNDSLQGNESNDNLYGDAGNDSLEGGSGKDYLSGGIGADVYLFGKGSGQDIVSNDDGEAVGTNADTILLGAGISIAGVALARGGDDLVIRINDSYDSLRVQSYFNTDGASSHVVENLTFADGTVWDVSTVKAKVLNSTVGDDRLFGYAMADTISAGDGNDSIDGSAGADVLDGGTGADTLKGGDGNDTLLGGTGNDALYGDNDNDSLQGNEGDDTISASDGNDSLEGGGGNDYLSGGTGADVYLFGKGSGQDTVSNGDGDAVGTNADTILLGAGISTAGVMLTRQGDDLLISLNASDDSLRVMSYFNTDGASDNVVENLKFADGTMWNYATVKSNLSTASAPVNGTDANDTLMGGQGNDSIYGNYGNDYLDGGAGNDYLDGGIGNDTYLFGKGSGKDTITAYDNTVGKADVIQLGAGVLTTEVVLKRNSDELVLSINGGTDALRVRNYFLNDANYGYQVEQIKFADGTIWDINAVKTKVLTPTSENDTLTGFATSDKLLAFAGDDTVEGRAGNDSLDGGAGSDNLNGEDGDDVILGGTQSDMLDGGNGADNLLGQDGNDTLYGSAGNDTLDGGAGNDYLHGGTGSDTYLFGKGSGGDTINAYDGTVGKVDVIQLGAGVLTTDVMLKRSGDNLDLYINGSADNLRVNDYFLTDATYGCQVEQIKFADGTIWDINAVKTKVMTATSENDTLTGFATADRLLALAEDVTVYARAGNDSLYGGAGSDKLYGEDGDDVILGGAQNDVLDGGNGADNLQGQGGVDSLYGQAGNDTLDGGAGNDYLDGGTGNNNYRFARGDGQDLILSTRDTTPGKLNTLQFKTGIAPTDISVNRDSDFLVLGIIGTTDKITVQNFFWNIDTTNSYNPIQQVAFTDAPIVWNITQLAALASASTSIGQGVLSGTSTGDRLQTFDANDALTGLAGADFLFAGAGDDTLDGGADDDWLYGGDGYDRLDGGLGADTLLGGQGDDTYIVDNLGDVVIDEAPLVFRGYGYDYDTIESSVSFVAPDFVDAIILQGSANLNATANEQDFDLVGNAGNNYLRGKGGFDYLQGMGGADTLEGGGGIDIYRLDDANDVVIEQENGGTRDEIWAYADGIVMAANVEVLRLKGSANLSASGNDGTNNLAGNIGNNTLRGLLGNDNLFGNWGMDTLEGGAGNDNLNGGLGSDTLIGGEGNDTYQAYAGDGADTVFESDSTGLSADKLVFSSTPTKGSALAEQLWFRKINNSLEISVIGTADKVTITDWYAAKGNQIEVIQSVSSGKSLTSDKVNLLVNAMSGFTPPAAGQTTLPPAYQQALSTAITQAWG